MLCTKSLQFDERGTFSGMTAEKGFEPDAALFIRQGNHRRFSDRGMTVELRLDFSQLDPVAPLFDHPIPAANEDVVSVSILTDTVPGPVPALARAIYKEDA